MKPTFSGDSLAKMPLHVGIHFLWMSLDTKIYFWEYPYKNSCMYHLEVSLKQISSMPIRLALISEFEKFGVL
jgi:hypothetical protein